MAHFVYSPADPFDVPPIGGATYYLALLPMQLPDAEVSTGKLRLFGGQSASLTLTGTGFGLSVTGGVPDVTGGTINGLILRYEGRVITRVTGLQVDAEEMFNYIQANNFIGYLNLIAKGHDRVDGTELADGISGWTGNDSVFGAKGDDMIEGHNGKDQLYGGRGNDTLAGQNGQDTLFGGKGADVFVFAESPGAAHRDVIRDFKPGVDEFRLDRDAFVGIGPVDVLAAESFRTGLVAKDGDDRILYQKSTGWLYFDPDGSGAADKIAFARVTAGLTLSASDFVVII